MIPAQRWMIALIAFAAALAQIKQPYPDIAPPPRLYPERADRLNHSAIAICGSSPARTFGGLRNSTVGMNSSTTISISLKSSR
jgi:hypothetical protein